MAYLLDSDVFISAKNAHYKFDIVPGFWDWIEREFHNGVLLSIDRVKQELVDPDVETWAQGCPNGFFVQPDEATAAALQTVSQWAAGATGYSQAAVATFLGAADVVLVAEALAHGHTVVTHEVSAPDSKSRIKIPDACQAVGVPCFNPYEMLDLEKPVFVLAP